MQQTTSNPGLPTIVPAEEREGHMKAVSARQAEGHGELEARVEQLRSRVSEEQRLRLMRQALSSKTVSQRILWLRREADHVATAAAGLTPCQAGCSRCCHTAVFVAEPEALAIGKAIGLTPVSVHAGRFTRASDIMAGGPSMEHASKLREQVQTEFYGAPCTFLQAGRCSIYAHRPMACRYLINLDTDDLLCRLVPGETVKARYFNMQKQQAGYIGAMGLNARIADIRDWFPSR